jgi:hypothetical protein
MNEESEKMWKWWWPDLTQYTDIYLEIARTITRRLSGGLYTNLGSPEYEARVLSIGTLFMYYHILILFSDVSIS